ncbi:conserved hypothetical integral membrane protein [Roseateles sp. YR242]|nr:conserved hypothetical integral membrane protein [Roseateles sp. YR242]
MRRVLPGLALCLLLAGLAFLLSRLPWMQAHGLSALTLAIVIGMVAGHTVYRPLAAAADPGVQFTRQTLLRLGIVLYGLKLTVQDIGHMGLAGVLADALVVVSTLGLGAWLGTRWLRLDRELALLIGAGSAICGAAAVMAAAPVVKARSEQVAPAIATVVVFGTLSMLLYPVLYHWNQQVALIPGGPHGFGLYTGATIHEVAQVVVAGRAMGAEAADAAVMAKMVRVMMLAPCLLSLGVWLARRGRGTTFRDRGASGEGVAVPWFAFAFIGVVLLNSRWALPAAVAADVSDLDTLLLAMAMAALGLGTQVRAVMQSGPRPLWLATLLFIWLVVGGAAIMWVTTKLFG